MIIIEIFLTYVMIKLGQWWHSLIIGGVPLIMLTTMFAASMFLGRKEK